MDTKLKSYRTLTYSISSVIAVIAAEAAVLVGCMLALVYHIKYGLYAETTGADGETYWQHVEIRGGDEHISALWMIEIGVVIIALAAIIVSLVKVGRKDATGSVVLNWFDKIFTDVQVLVGALAFCGIVLMSMPHVDWLCGSDWYQEYALGLLNKEQMEQFSSDIYFYNSEFEPRWLELLFCIVANLFLMSVFLILLQSLVKKLKTRAFWRHTIIGKVVCYIADAIGASDEVFWKVMVTAIVAVLLSATWLGMIPVLIFIFIFIPKWVKKYCAVKEGINQIKRGNLDYKIPVAEAGELDRLAMSVNEISDAMNIAVMDKLKNQKMKIDLISNVSHDLRTPLTSMVSYVDLLKTEGLDSENASMYLEIIDEKTRRLRKLTEDLFEAAKASSGNIPVDINRIEMTSIVNQAMAEMEERLSENNLDVIFTNKAESIFVMADGQLLWRVIENLLTNVSKYALPASRVYIDISEENDMICLDVKNMSKDRLNISADELMERFKRGDESRNTEGSGLGLAIAKDLTNLMNGAFELTIDGDLFKVRVALVKAV